MNYFRIILFNFLCVVSLHCFGQDTLKYCHNSYYVSNCYFFYKSTTTASKGVFEKFMAADDGQYWYGTGQFRETRTKIIIDPFNHIRKIYNYDLNGRVKDSSASDTTKIMRVVLYKRKNGLLQPSKTKKTYSTFFTRQ